MLTKTFGNLTIEFVQGDIANQPDVDAVVNAANAALLPGSGVAGAIHRAAGPGLAEECRSLAPIVPGQAVITAGHGLPNAHVIHCLGPVYGRDEPAATLLASCYQNALRLAEARALSSIAFPAIATGVFGYPMAEAAQIALVTVLDAADRLHSITRIRFVLFNRDDLHQFERILLELTAS